MSNRFLNGISTVPVIDPSTGGTGVNNGNRTITISGFETTIVTVTSGVVLTIPQTGTAVISSGVVAATRIPFYVNTTSVITSAGLTWDNTSRGLQVISAANAYTYTYGGSVQIGAGSSTSPSVVLTTALGSKVYTIATVLPGQSNQHVLQILDTSVQRMAITTSGQVIIGPSIGTDTNAALVVTRSGQSALDLQDTSGTAARWRLFTNKAGLIGGDATFGFYNVQNGATPLVFNEAGKVGIGPTDPSASLDVTGTIRIRDNGATVAPSAGMGVELLAISAIGYVQSYDRTAGAWRVLNLNASEISLNPSGSAVLVVQSSNVNVNVADLRISGTKVLGSRVTGWTAPTGTLTRGSFSSAATLAVTAQTLAALITDLRTHGLINT